MFDKPIPSPHPAAPADSGHPACEDCRYFQAQQNGHGLCLRYPPAYCYNGAPAETHRWRHPQVLARNWCGEHRAAD